MSRSNLHDLKAGSAGWPCLCRHSGGPLACGVTILLVSLLTLAGLITPASQQPCLAGAHDHAWQSALLQKLAPPAAMRILSLDSSGGSGTGITLSLSFRDQSGRAVVNGTLTGLMDLDPAKGIAFDLLLEQTTLQLAGLSSSLTGSFVGSLSPNQDRIFLESWELELANPRVISRQNVRALPDMSLSGRDTRVLGRDTLQFGLVRIGVKGRSLASGQLEMTPKTGLQVRGSIQVPPLVELLESLKPGQPIQVNNPSGKELEFDFSLPFSDPEKAPSASVSIVSRQALSLSSPAPGLDISLPPGDLSIRVSKPPETAWTEAAHARIDYAARKPLAFGPARMNSPEISTLLSWDGSGLQAENTRIRASGLLLSSANGTFRTGSFQATAQSLGLFPGLESENSISLHFADLGTMSLDLKADPALKAIQAQLQTGPLDLGSLIRLTAQTAVEPFPENWSTQGGLACSGQFAHQKPETGLTLNCTLDDLALASPDGSILTDKVAADLSAAFEKNGQERNISSRLEIRQGEALWGTRYVDFASIPLRLSLEGHSAGPILPADLNLKANWTGIGELTVGSRIVPSSQGLIVRGDSSLKSKNLARLLALALPGLESLDISGQAGFDGRFIGAGSGLTLQGSFAAHEIGILPPGNATEVQGASLDLPMHLVLGQPGQSLEADLPAWGRLNPGKVRVQGRNIQISPVQVSLQPEELLTRGVLKLKSSGIQVALSNIVVHDPVSSEFEVRAGLRLDELDLHKLSPESFPLQGKIKGQLPAVSLNQDRLSTAGELTGTFFGGELTLSELLMIRPFDPSRELGGTCQVKALHLEELSSSVGVGRVTGRMNVNLQNLQLAFGQPVAFALRAKSAPAQGVKQRISLQAVNSLSILGTGRGLSGLGVRFYANFFQEFPYENIGLACVLKNDTFTLSGLIHEDDVEYIVKRPLLGINVINTTPHNRIAFSDMLKRINRIAEQSGTQQQGNPQDSPSPDSNVTQ